ncbi:MAG: cyclophilin-like fold protein [Anditalea sp.]
MKTLFLLLHMLTGVFLFPFNSSQQEVIRDNSKRNSMKLKITVGETILTATMHGHPASRDFVSLLPLNLTLTDYAGTEKVSDLPKMLSTKDAPAGYKPSAGDITFYAPWGNLALFYSDFSYSNGLILLGKLDGEMDVFKTSGAVQVKIELIQ